MLFFLVVELSKCWGKCCTKEHAGLSHTSAGDNVYVSFAAAQLSHKMIVKIVCSSEFYKTNNEEIMWSVDERTVATLNIVMCSSYLNII